MGTIFDDPNREAVGLEPAWVEGTGGEGGSAPEPPEQPVAAGGEPTADELDAMTKDELLAYAQQIGASPANAGMTKDEIRASIDTARG